MSSSPQAHARATARAEERRQKAEGTLELWFLELRPLARADRLWLRGAVAMLNEFEILTPARCNEWLDRIERGE